MFRHALYLSLGESQVYALFLPQHQYEKNPMEGVIFIGAQASGKSSFYLEKYYKTHIRINMDMLKTRCRERIIFNACLEAKQRVVVDNTNPMRVDREKYINGLKSFRFNVIGYYFAAKLEYCLARNALREGKDCIPEVGVRATYRKLELPTYAEGFDQLYYVTLENGAFRVKEWKNKL